MDNPVHEFAKSLKDSAFTMDVSRNITDFNRAFVKLHKLDPQQVRKAKGQCCQNFVKLEICETACVLKQSLETGLTVRLDEVKGKTLTGEDLTLIVMAMPIKNAAGEVASVVEIHRDVTDEAKIHEKYTVLLEKEKRAKEELEYLVDQRTQALRKANEELKRAESQLVHSEKMSSLGQMVAGIAHELNNPINFIHGNADILADYAEEIKGFVSDLDALVQESSDIAQKLENLKDARDIAFTLEDMDKISSSIRKGTERAADVIKGLRTFSRLDEADLKATNVHEDIDMTLMILKSQLGPDIVVEKSYEAASSFVCYASQLNQVYMNLLQNAIHAVKGKGTIRIATRMQGEGMHIQISDTGVGIPPDVLPKIFDPFFTTKAVGEGTGLGLSVSYGIVEKHGGKIEVQSEVGKGTTFSIVLPKQSENT